MLRYAIKMQLLINCTFDLCVTLQSPNSVITYEISSKNPNANKFFGISTTYGNISISQPLTNDVEQNPLYNVSINTTYKGG